MFVWFVLLHLWYIVNGETDDIPYSPDDLYQMYPDYGVKWMFIPDGNGVPTVAVLNAGEDVDVRLDNDEQRLKASPVVSTVTFLLYTRQNLNETYELEFNNTENLINSPFDHNKDIKFITHGWRSSGYSDTCQTIKDAFLEKEDVNVIILNWEEVSDNIIYFIPMLRTRAIGQFYADMINYLIENGANLKQIHLIGHSLGAHVSGIAGSLIKNGKVSRITGLDPALPGFEYAAEKEHRLDDSDGEFVDIIHTCGGILGYYHNLGDLDVFPNGGTPSQPGCAGFPEFIEACSHGRAWQYYAESIRMSDKFKAVRCDSWMNFKKGLCADEPVIVGNAVNTSLHGAFFTVTNSIVPYTDNEEILQQYLK